MQPVDLLDHVERVALAPVGDEAGHVGRVVELHHVGEHEEAERFRGRGAELRGRGELEAAARIGRQRAAHVAAVAVGRDLAHALLVAGDQNVAAAGQRRRLAAGRHQPAAQRALGEPVHVGVHAQPILDGEAGLVDDLAAMQHRDALVAMAELELVRLAVDQPRR